MREQTGIVQLGWVVMLGEVPCEDVVGPSLPRLSDKGLAVGKGRGSSLAMFSSAISGEGGGGLAPDFPCLLS